MPHGSVSGFPLTTLAVPLTQITIYAQRLQITCYRPKQHWLSVSVSQGKCYSPTIFHQIPLTEKKSSHLKSLALCGQPVQYRLLPHTKPVVR